MVTTEPNLKIHRGKREKIRCFAFCVHVDVIKIEKHLRFPFSPRRLLGLSSYARVQS